MVTATTYDPKMTVREARARYFADNDFGENGGYDEAWVILARLGPLPLGFPNTAGRIRAVRYHDLHHLATGYGTDAVGEAEIAAWELGGGCQGFTAAWVLNTSALAMGILRAPERMRTAFARGARTGNLYTEPFTDELLAERLGDLRARLGLDPEDADMLTSTQRRRFRRFVILSFTLNLTLILVVLAVIAAVILGLARWFGR